MKVVVFEKCVQGGWYLLADSAITNTGKPFYLPDDYGTVSVSIGMAVRIDRIGKSISPKFASRYYHSIAPVLHFRMSELEEKLRSEGLPADASRNFDRSLFVGEFRPLSEISDLFLTHNGVEVAKYDTKKQILCVDELISGISRLNTMKMGDFIVPGLSVQFTIKEGDILEVKDKDNTLFYVKVK